MVATTMPSINSLISKLQTSYPDITFKDGTEFSWSSKKRTVTYASASENAAPQLLHELSHALLDHKEYLRDISLIGIERDAWEYAKLQLAPLYNVIITEETAEDALDSYRDWLHARSTCPSCQAIGIETLKRQYKCLVCNHQWRVNEARICVLRRYQIQK
jgi:predicted RecB family nuclease